VNKTSGGRCPDPNLLRFSLLPARLSHPCGVALGRITHIFKANNFCFISKTKFWPSKPWAWATQGSELLINLWQSIKHHLFGEQFKRMLPLLLKFWDKKAKGSRCESLISSEVLFLKQ